MQAPTFTKEIENANLSENSAIVSKSKSSQSEVVSKIRSNCDKLSPFVLFGANFKVVRN